MYLLYFIFYILIYLYIYIYFYICLVKQKAGQTVRPYCFIIFTILEIPRTTSETLPSVLSYNCYMLL